VIGLFDSGVGGLTIFKEIARRYPTCDLIYIGDTAHLPYGEKSPSAVKRYSHQMVERLIEQGATSVVVACHTASAIALDDLQEHFSIPIIGVIDSGVAAAVKRGSDRIGIIGTRATIESGIYQQAINRELPAATIHAIATPLFVPLIEEGYASHEVARLIVAETLGSLDVDTLLLACTHYPLLEPVIRAEMGETLEVVHAAAGCAAQIDPPPGSGRRLFFATDAPERFRLLSSRFLEEELPVVSLSSQLAPH